MAAYHLKRALAVAILLCMIARVSCAETISPRRLLELTDIDEPVVSPDGRGMAFRVEQASAERNTYDTVWYVQGMDGASPPVRVASGGVPLKDSAGISLPAVATWSLDGRWIYYRALLDGRIDVWRAATDGSVAEPVTRDPADVRSFALSADGRTLRYSVGATREEVLTAEQAEYDQGIRIDESVPIGQSLFRSGFIEGRLATQRFSKAWFDRVSLLNDVPDHWKAVDLVTQATRNLTSSEIPVGPLSASELAARLPKPWLLASDPLSGRIALLTRIGDQDGLAERPGVELAMLSDEKATRPAKCVDQMCTGKAITGLQWRPDSDEVVFTVTDPDMGFAQSIFRWNVISGTVSPLVASQGLLSGGRDSMANCGISAEALVCVAADAAQPPRLERIDLETGGRKILFDPNASLAQDMTRGAQVRLLHWMDTEGRPITGQFYPAQKSGEGPSPLFVSYYRCDGFVRGAYGDEWPLASLAEQGVAALCINKSATRMDAVDRYDRGRQAVEGAINMLAEAGEIDRTKVGMGGLSFGSEVTLWTVIHSDLVAAASVSSVAISQQYYLVGSMKGNVFFSGLREGWQLGAPDETTAQWRMLSPALNLEKIHCPILMQTPEQEYIQALDYAIPLIRDHRADLYVFSDEPHQKFQPRHKLAVYQRNLDWFRFWLQGVEDPDPTKAEQYARWRIMKARFSTLHAH